jgi:pimeloyl-ACP methyl ester carboxylesterase
MTSADTTPPDWFARAVATPGERRFVEVEGCAIHYLRWGEPTRPGLLFVPPGGGHARWFEHVAPLFADQFHVLAMDPSGCGDSGRREAYSRELVTAEIAGVLADSGLLAAATPPTLVGHSAGAQLAVRAALAHGERLLGVISIDGLRYARLEKDHAIKVLEGPRPEPRPAKVYDSFEAATARFRLSPTPLMEVGNGFIVDHIARQSYRQVEGGWASKHDPAQGAVISLAFELLEALNDLPCHAAAIYSEHTHLADETAPDAIAAATGGKVVSFRVPGTSHYPMIDSPFAFVAAVKGVALTWIAARAAAL